MSTSACFTTCAPLHAVAAEQQVGGDRPAGRDVGDAQRLEPVEAGELLVHAGRVVETVDERVGERAPVRTLLVAHLDPACAFRPRGRASAGSSGRARW